MTRPDLYPGCLWTPCDVGPQFRQCLNRRRRRSLTSSRKKIESVARPFRPPADVYVCLTSLPERILSKQFRHVIRGLQRQQFASGILLSLPDLTRDGRAYKIPGWLRKAEGVKIVRCPVDMGPATKLLGGYKSVPADALMCVVDDDRVYAPRMLRDLLKLHSRVGGIVTCLANAQGHPMGAHGYLFRRGDLDIDEVDIKLLTQFGSCVDDTWLGVICNKKNIVLTELGARRSREFTRVDWKSLSDDVAKRKRDIARFMTAAREIEYLPPNL